MSLTPPRTLTRLPYFTRWLIFMVSVGVFVALLLPLMERTNSDFPEVFLIIVVIVFVAFRLAYLDIPRARSIPWSPWVLLLVLIPGVGFVLQILLFVLPAKFDAPKVG